MKIIKLEDSKNEIFEKVCEWNYKMNTVNENAKKANLTELYLYTKHIGLYEKFGWEFIEEVKTFKEDSPIERLYRLEIK